MADKRIFIFAHAEARRRAAEYCMTAPDGHAAVISEPTRTLPMNAKFHALCTDLSKSGLVWAGKKRTAAQWKVLLVSGHASATGEQVEIIPGLEGEFINIRESTALMSIKRGSSLIEYTVAFCAMNDVVMNEYRRAA